MKTSVATLDLREKYVNTIYGAPRTVEPRAPSSSIVDFGNPRQPSVHGKCGDCLTKGAGKKINRARQAKNRKESRTVLSTCAQSVALVFGIKLPRHAWMERVGANSGATGLETTAFKEWLSIFLE